MLFGDDNMDKSLLRDKLFQKYFECTDGILISDLVDKLSYIPLIWSKLHLLCQINIKYFHPFSLLYGCKLIEYNKKKYLILKIGCWNYVIIDIKTKKNITNEEFESDFNEDFFVNNFGERRENDENMYYILYDISKYNGDIDELLDFYIENENILNLSSELSYEFNVDGAITSLDIDFINAKAIMTFLTRDQLLYEHLFLNYDLTPSLMQDAHEKMGIEKMNEIFNKIKEMRIPIEWIPNDLYLEYLNQCNKKVYTRNI